MKRLILAIALLACAGSFARAADPSTAQTAPARPTGVHFIYLIRHGMYDRDDKVDDRVGNALSPLGHEQARLLGARLAALPIKFHALVSSDFTRARETADDIGVLIHMTAVRDSLIHECTPTAEHPEYNTNHTSDDITLCVSNLEAAWAKYFVPTPDADTHDLLVCHGNVIRWLMLKSMGADVRRWYGSDIANASLTIIAATHGLGAVRPKLRRPKRKAAAIHRSWSSPTSLIAPARAAAGSRSPVPARLPARSRARRRWR